MKIETQTKQNIEQQQDISMPLDNDESVLAASVNMPFADLLSQQMNTDDLLYLDIDYNYDSISMNLEDAMFFVNLTQNAQYNTVQNPNGQFESLIQTEIIQNTVTNKTVEATNKLTELIEKAQNTQKPVRISFDNDVSVILKIDKHGKLTAEFIPGSYEVENYLRNNIAALRQKFDEQNLPYNDLLYRQNNRQNRKNKEKGEINGKKKF